MTLSEAWAATHPDAEAELTEQIRAAANQIERISADARCAWRAADVSRRNGSPNNRADCLEQWLHLTEEMNDMQAHMNRLALELCRAKAGLLAKEGMGS